MVSSTVIAAMAKLLLGSIREEPLHSVISLLTILVIFLGGSAGGLLVVLVVERLAGRT